MKRREETENFLIDMQEVKKTPSTPELEYGCSPFKRIVKTIFGWVIIAIIIFAMIHVNMKGSVDYADVVAREYMRQQNQIENAQITSEQYLTH